MALKDSIFKIDYSTGQIFYYRMDNSYLSWVSWSRALPAKEIESISFDPSPPRFPGSEPWGFGNVPTLTGNVYSNDFSFGIFLWNNHPNSTYNGKMKINVDNVKKTNYLFNGHAIRIDLDNLSNYQLFEEIPLEYNLSIDAKSKLGFFYLKQPSEKLKLIFSNLPEKCFKSESNNGGLGIEIICNSFKKENDLIIWANYSRDICENINILEKMKLTNIL